MYLRKRGYIRTISDHQLVKSISRMRSLDMGSMGKLLQSRLGSELMVDSPETPMTISSLRLLLKQGEEGINKLDIDSRLSEVSLG
jgi:hypothetical protein